MKKSKIIITGANGQLGKCLKKIIKSQENYIFTDIEQLDICNIEQIDTFFKTHNVKLIINCAAYTAVDQAEEEYDKAMQVNSTALKNIATSAKQYNVNIIHISTDYVFDGKSNIPYREEHETNPINAYGKTKLEGEKHLQNILGSKSVIIRTAWLYSEFNNNFFKTICKLSKSHQQIKVVYDQVGTPTYAGDLAECIIKITDSFIQDNKWEGGIYHFANQGVCSWYDFAYQILKLTKADCSIKPVLSNEFPTKAKRPIYSVLNKSKIIANYCESIPHWTESLEKCIDN